MTADQIIMIIVSCLVSGAVGSMFIGQRSLANRVNSMIADIAVIKEKLDNIKTVKDDVRVHETNLAIHKERLDKAERDINAWHQKHRELRESINE